MLMPCQRVNTIKCHPRGGVVGVSPPHFFQQHIIVLPMNHDKHITFHNIKMNNNKRYDFNHWMGQNVSNDTYFTQ